MTATAIKHARPAASGRRGEDVLGYSVFDRPVGELVTDVLAAVAESPRARATIACLNPHSWVVAASNRDFSDALHHATWLVPDGAGIVLASRVLSGKIRGRITGHDVLTALSAALNSRGPFSAMFIGSTDTTLAAIRNRYRLDYPNAHDVQVHSPPYRARFTDEDLHAIETLVNQHRPQLLWLGLTAPKQEVLMLRLRRTCDFGVAGAIGAVFDFYVGNIRRSSPRFQRLGLEWLPRLLREPRRLWRRTFVSAPRFLLAVMAQRLRRRGSRTGANR